ncbi:MAG: tyrosine-type recombinase/integrase, partial [Candidatus Dormibacteria bacterium]
MANTNPTKTRRTKGTGGIAHRPDGRWEATLRGQHYYLPTKLDAERKLRDLLNLIDKGVDPAPESLTVGALLTGWLEGHRAAVRPSTFRSHEQVVRLHLLPRLGSVRVNRLQPDDVSGMMTALAAEGKAPGTIRLVRVVLSAALQSAIDAGKLSRNAARIAKAPRVEDSTPFVPTPELARAIIEACGEYSEELRRAVAFGMTTGLRIGEQQGLRWQDADLDGGYLRITHTLTRKLTESGGLAGYVLAPVKTAKSRRRVDLGSSAVAILKAEREAQTDAVGPIPDLVFRTAKGDARTTDPQHL